MPREAISDEARRIEEDLLWNETAHLQMATLWRATHWVLGIPIVVLTATAGLAAVKSTRPGLVVACALTSTVLGALQTFLNPQKAAKDAHSAGVRASALRARVRRFHEIDLKSVELPRNARSDLERLATDKTHLLQTTPHTGGVAYWLARKGLARRQHIHVVDAVRPDKTVVT